MYITSSNLFSTRAPLPISSGILSPDGDSCTNVTVDSTTQFDVTVTLDSCADFGTQRK